MKRYIKAAVKPVSEEDGYVQWTLANNAAASPRMLSELVADDTNTGVLQAVAMNPNTPAEALLRMLDLPQYYPGLGEHIVFNPNITPEILARLADSGSDRVKMWVARKPKTPANVLERLAKGRMAEHVCRNPNIPRELLDKLVVHGSSDVLCSIAVTESTPVDILERLSHNGSYLVRGYVASNRSTPEWLVKKLAKDPDISVRHAASEAAFRRGIKL